MSDRAPDLRDQLREVHEALRDCNPPERPNDVNDIRELVARHHATIDRGEARRYFELFASEALWRELFDGP